MSGKKNLIIGLWWRLPFDGLERFVASLRATTFDGDICVFVEDVPAATVRSLMAHGVIVERPSRFALSQMTLQAARYYCYLDFLARHGNDYANVMISDLRDVIFQSDPFAVPLPADLVFAQERRLIGECPVNRSWLIQTYGEALAENWRDCMVSCSGTTFGTVQGMQQYLIAMVNEMAGRPVPILGGLDQAIHNYVIRMRPLRNSFCDPDDRLVATLAYIPDEAVEVTGRGVLIDGRLVPVVHQWDRHKGITNYVMGTPKFRLNPVSSPHFPVRRRSGGTTEPVAPPPDSSADAVVCFYHRARDAEFFAVFLASLRSVGFAGSAHCVGEFTAAELAILARHGCVAHPISVDSGMDIDNASHIYMARVLNELATDPAVRPDQVLLMDTMRAGFLRDPFLAKTIGLSVFREGPARIGDSDYNIHRLSLFQPVDDAWRRKPIVSSAVLRGKLEVVQEFYRRLADEFATRQELLPLQNAVQGAFNKLSHGGDLGFPVIQFANTADTHFEIWPQSLIEDTRFAVRVGGTVPAIVVNPFFETPLMRTLKAAQQISSTLETG